MIARKQQYSLILSSIFAGHISVSSSSVIINAADNALFSSRPKQWKSGEKQDQIEKSVIECYFVQIC